jgi:hypothetical protein
MIIGTVDNSATARIDFPFFTGPAGIRQLTDGRLLIAFMMAYLPDKHDQDRRQAEANGLNLAPESGEGDADLSVFAEGISGRGQVGDQSCEVEPLPTISRATGMVTMYVRPSQSEPTAEASAG